MKEKLANPDWRVVIVCAVCITAMEVTALLRGVDGVYFSAAVIAVSGLGGFVVRSLIR